MSDDSALGRWRLVLGGDAESSLGSGASGDDARRDRRWDICTTASMDRAATPAVIQTASVPLVWKTRN